MNKLKELFDVKSESTGRFVYLSILVLSMYVILSFPITRELFNGIVLSIIYLAIPTILLRKFVECLEFFVGRVKKWINKKV